MNANGNGPKYPTYATTLQRLSALHGPGCRCCRKTTPTAAKDGGKQVRLDLNNSQPIRNCYGTIASIDRTKKSLVLLSDGKEIEIPLDAISEVYEITYW